jgi:hypothetical protein
VPPAAVRTDIWKKAMPRPARWPGQRAAALRVDQIRSRTNSGQPLLLSRGAMTRPSRFSLSAACIGKPPLQSLCRGHSCVKLHFGGAGKAAQTRTSISAASFPPSGARTYKRETTSLQLQAEKRHGTPTWRGHRKRSSGTTSIK